MELALLGFWIGLPIAVAIRWSRRKRFGAKIVALRQAPAALYRDALAAAPSFAEVVAAWRAAGLGVRPQGERALEIHDTPHHLRITVDDPARVELSAIAIESHGSATLDFAAALALVPIYGPLLFTDDLLGEFVVDGSLDALALSVVRHDRLRAYAAHAAARVERNRARWEQLLRRR